MNYDENFESKYYEKNFGLTPADLLILEIKKPNKPQLQKSGSVINRLRKNISFDENKYKNPKVRIII